MIMLLMNFSGTWTGVVHAANDIVAVTTYDEFVKAYNNPEVGEIRLLNDIICGAGIVPALHERVKSVKISGENPERNFKLDLRTHDLPFGNDPSNTEVISLENLIIANNPSVGDAFIKGSHTHKMNIYLKNIQSEPSVSASSDKGHLMRAVSGFSTRITLEGNIDVKTRREFAEVGSVLVKRGTNFKTHQEHKTGSAAYSQFWFGPGSLPDEERRFIVEDDVVINWTRDVASNYPPVYQHYKDIIVGDNVTWNQDNYLHFISNQLDTANAKNIKFGNRCKINATNSERESIQFDGARENSVEFGPGSSLKINGGGNIIELGSKSKVVFRNPVGLDLESTGGRVFNMATGGKTELQYVTFDTWNYGSNTSGSSDARFEKVTNAVLEGGGLFGMHSVVSDNANLVSHFKKNNSKRILTEKIEVGDVAVQYTDQSGNAVGQPIPIEFDKSGYVVDEGVPIPDELRTKPSIPDGYHYDTEVDQPEYAYTGMQGIDDPRVTKMYIHGDPTNITVKYVNVRNTENIVSQETFEKNAGDIINLNTDEFKAVIKAPFTYANAEDLLEGQEQLGEVSVVPNGEYIIYVIESQELVDAKDNAKTELDDKANSEKELVDTNDNLSDDDKKIIKEEIDKAIDEGKKEIDNAVDKEGIDNAKDKGILQIEKEAAKAEVIAKANEKNRLIDGVEGADTVDVEKSKTEVEKEKNLAFTNIDGATTVETVNTEKTNGITAIENVELPKSGLDNLNTVKAEAKTAIEAAATAKNTEIDSLEGVSEEEKTKAKDQVNKFKAEGLANVEIAASVEDVNTEKETAINNINSVRPETDDEILADAKAEAKTAIEAAATAKNTEIDGLEGVSEEEKTKAKDQVNKFKDEGYTSVDNATTVADVNTEKETAINNINSVKPETDDEKLAEAKDNAKTELDDKANSEKELVDANDNLSDDDKIIIKDAIDKANDEGKKEIDNAVDKEGIDNAKDKGILQIEKEAAKAEVIAKANEKNRLIDGVEGADTVDVEKSKTEVEKEKNLAFTNIDDATTIETVNTAKSNGLIAIENVELPKSGLDNLNTAKEDAKAAIEGAATAKNAEIDTLEGVSEEEKTKAKDQVNKFKTDGIADVEIATSVEDVNTKKKDAIDNINSVKPETDDEKLAEAKDNAKTELDDKANSEKELVDANDNLSDDDKIIIKDAIDKANDEGKKEIDNAVDKEGIDNAKDKGILQIEKEAAKAEVIAKANEKNRLIDGVEGADTVDVEKSKTEVEKEKNLAFTNIDEATTAETVNTAKSEGLIAIENVELPKSGLDNLNTAKAEAKTAIEAAATAKNVEIDGLEGVSEEEKAKAKDQVNKFKTDGIANVESATSVEDVNTEKETAINNINSVKPETDDEKLTEAKDNAKTAIEAAATAKNAEIDGLEGVSEEEKTKAKDQVNKFKDEGYTSVDNATTVADVNTEKETAINNINSVKPETDDEKLAEAKDNAKTELDDKANSEKELVDANDNLSDDDKIIIKDAIDKANDEGKKEIDNAVDKEGIDNAKDKGILQIEKEAAKAEVIAKANEKNRLIDGVEGADTVDVEKSKTEVEKEKNLAFTNIDDATTIETVNTAKSNGLIAIENVELPKSGLDNLNTAKEDAKAAIEGAATAKNAEIDTLEGVSEEEKTKAKDQVNKFKTEGLANVDNATTVEGVNTEKDAAIVNINSVTAETDDEKLTEAKAEAKTAIEAAATAKNTEIDGLEGVSEEDKTKAKEKVNSFKADGIANVESATSIEDVNTKKKDAIDNINSVTAETDDEILADAKADAKNAIEGAATAKNAEIEGLEGVSEEEKTKAKEKVNNFKTEGIEKVESATSVEDVTTKKKDAIDNINSVTAETEDEKLAEAKADAKTELDGKANIEKDLVDANDNLSDDDKKIIKEEIDKAINEGQKEIDNAVDKEGIDNAKDKVILQIEKESAKAEIIAKSNEKNRLIDGVEGADTADVERAKTEVEDEKNLAITNIDGATTIETVNTAKSNGLIAIENVELPKSGLDNLNQAKAAAKNAIEEAANAKNAEIDGLEGVSEEEKTKAKDKVNSFKAEGIGNVEGATTVEDVNTEKDKAINNINSVDVIPSEPGEDIETVKESAVDEIEKLADEKIDEIKNVPNAKEEDINRAIDEVNREKDNAIGKIESGNNIEDVIHAKDEGIKKIKEIPLPMGYTPEEDRPNNSGLNNIIWDWGYNDTPTEKIETEKIIFRAYLNGYPDGTVRPDGEVTRGEVAAILARLKLDSEDVEYTSKTEYSDVSTEDWFAASIAYVSDKGIMTGYEDGTFKPNEKISRAEYAVALARFKNLTVMDSKFSDVKGHWAEGYIGAVENAKWINGYEDGLFHPEFAITRAEVASMTNKMLDREIDATAFYGKSLKEFTDMETSAWYYEDMMKACNTFEFAREKK